MDSFEINKILSAIIIVLIFVVGLGKISDKIFEVKKPEKPGYKVEIDTQLAASDSSIGGTEEKFDIAAFIATGNLDHGKKVFKKCSACHSIVDGGGNKIGPALYNVVGRAVGGVSDYKYSKALEVYGKNWTVAELNGFLIKPATYIKGTKMAYAGLKNEKDRASVIMYLNNSGDNPLTLP